MQSVKLAHTIVDLVGCEEIESVHLVEALHATQSPEADVELAIDYQRGYYGYFLAM